VTSDFVHSDVVNATGAASSHAGTPGTPEGAPLPDVIVDVNGQSLAEETFRLAWEACQNGMVMVGHDGKMIMANTEVEQQFGYRREELIGQPVEMLVPMSRRRQHAHHKIEALLNRIYAPVDDDHIKRDIRVSVLKTRQHSCEKHRRQSGGHFDTQRSLEFVRLP